MPVSALPAMRAAIAYSAPAATGNTWADYANTMFDSLLAVEFRNASSLAEATLYGSTPSIVEQPGGGLVFGANGLECAENTMLNTSILPDDANYCVGALMYNTSVLYAVAIGAYDSTAPGDLYVGLFNGNIYFGYGAGGTATVSGIDMPATAFQVGPRRYTDGVYQSTSAGTWNDFSTYPLYIAARNKDTPDRKWNGIISAVFAGKLKAGADADTVASELHTRMQTAAL